jgi:hypothetical protein
VTPENATSVHPVRCDIPIASNNYQRKVRGSLGGVPRCEYGGHARILVSRPSEGVEHDSHWDAQGYEGVVSRTIKKHNAQVHTQSVVYCVIELETMSSATTIGLNEWVFPQGQVTTNHLSSSIPNGTPYGIHDEEWNTTGCSL